jgi:hypothetical protein
MIPDDALRPTGRAECIYDRHIGIGWHRGPGGYAGGTAVEFIDVEHWKGAYLPGHREVCAVRHESGGLRLLQYVVESGSREGALQRHLDLARFQHAEKRGDHERHPVFGKQRYRSLAQAMPTQDGLCHPIGGLIQLSVSQGMAPRLDGDAGGIAPHLLLKASRNRLLDLLGLKLDEGAPRMATSGPD